jgi:tetratricopeptide (TPR) repeat protein
MLVAALEPSPRVQVRTRSRLADALRSAGRPASRIDETLAREVARHVPVGVLLVPSVQRFDDVYAVQLRAIDLARDTYLFAIRDEAAGKRAVLAALDRLASRARGLLGESASDVASRPGFRAETIASLDAYRHYYDALRYSDQGLFEQEQAELRAAIAADPDLGLAHLRLAVSEYGFPPVPAEERARHLEAALRTEERLPEPDRLVVRGELAISKGRVAEGAALLEQAARLRPDKRVLYRLAWLRPAGDLYPGRPYLRSALELDPSWFPAQNDLLISYAWNGEHAEAERLASEWARRWPSQLTYGALNGGRLWAGDFDGALEAARKAEELGPGLVAHVGRTLLVRGEFAGAEAELRRLWDRGERVLYDVDLAGALHFRGKLREAERVLDELERSGPAGAMLARQRRPLHAVSGRDPEQVRARVRAALPEADHLGRVQLALALAMAGAPGEAERVLDTGDAGPPLGPEAGLDDAVRAVVAAGRARVEGRDLVRARRILEDARGRAVFAWRRTLDYFIGEACHLANDDRCTVDALSGISDARWGFQPGAAGYHRSQVLLATSHERLGQTGEARRVVERLLRELAEADPDLPALGEAKAVCARVACRR